MSIAEQFAGMDMQNLIGGPLMATANANLYMAQATAKFINDVGIDANGKVRTASFGYERRTANEDGTSNVDTMKVDIPMLAIVPIPNLQVDEVNILFDMEVKQSEKSESATDWGGSLTGSMNLGIFKVSITGNVSSHSSNTRSSDNSAKYHVDVRAGNHGTPEGLARVLDIMASCVSPTMVSSELKDGNGQALPDDAKKKAETLKALRAEISSMEAQVSAAQSNLDNRVSALKKVASGQQSVYQAAITQEINSLDPNDQGYDDCVKKYSDVANQINQIWSTFQNRAADLVKLVSDSVQGQTPTEVSGLFALKGLSTSGSGADKFALADYADGASQYQALLTAQNTALTAQQSYDQLEDALMEKKGTYNSTIMGAVPQASAQSGQNGQPVQLTGSGTQGRPAPVRPSTEKRDEGDQN